ncbi:MAG: RNA polymerase sigma factor [Acidimicrobiales bacterium]
MRSGPAPGSGDESAERPMHLVPPLGTSAAASAWSDQVKATYIEVRAPLWRALVAWSGDVDVADEAVAEAFAQLLRRGADVLDPAAWVWRAAFRVAAGDLQRRRRRSRAGADPEVLELVPSAADRLPDDAMDLVDALQALTDQQRQCIALVDVAGHTAPSAAEILGTSAATVRVQLMRARRQLRTLLADSNPDPGAPSTGSEIHPETRP